MGATPDALPVVSALASAYGLPYPIDSVSGARLLEAVNGESLEVGFTFHFPPESTLWSAPLALDGLAIIVHSTNPVSSLTLRQVRDIFTGRVNGWAEVGGGSGPIQAMAREPGSDLAEAFAARVLQGERSTLTALVAPGPAEMVEGVARDPLAIGYASYGLVTPEAKVIAIEGVLPEAAAFEGGTYPLPLPLFALAQAEPQGAVRDFLIWIQSPEGQAALGERYGRIP